MKPSTIKKQIPLSLSIYNASQIEKKLGDYEPKSKDQQALITELGVWSALVGYKCTAQELKVIESAVRKSFPTYNLLDIKTARDLSSEGKFVTQYHGNFSVIYVNTILSEYRKFRGESIVSEKQKRAKIEAEKPLPKPEPNERLETFKTILKNAYDHQKDINKESDYVDLGNVLYDFIKANKLLTPTKEMIQSATEYARKIYLQSVKEKNYGAVIRKEHIEKRQKANEKVIQLQKQYIVITFLNNFKTKKDFSKFVETVTIDMIHATDGMDKK